VDAARSKPQRPSLEQRIEQQRSPFRAFLVPALWTAATAAILIAAAVWFVLGSGRDRPAQVARVPQLDAGRGAPVTGAPRADGSATSRVLAEATGPVPDDPVVAAIEQRHAAGELADARRLPGGCVVARVAWIDAGPSQIRKVVEQRAGGVTIARWYDDAGRLRAAQAAGPGGELRVVLDTAGQVSSAAGGDGPLRALALAARDPSTALFGPPRCDPP
jgi:hypothetical protein